MVKIKSVFFKFIASFLLINIFSYAALAFIMSVVINNYGSDVKENTLQNACNSISTYLSTERADESYKSFVFDEAKVLKRVMQYLSINDEGMLMFVTDEKGLVLLYGGADNIGITSEAFSDGRGRYNVFGYSEDFEKTLRSGESVYQTDDMYGFLKFSHVYCALPIIEENGDYSGAVFAMSSNTDVDVLAGKMFQTVILAAVWIMIASLVIMYFILDRFISPIREMSKAAKSFAGGNMDARVKVKGDDEITELASSFNNMADSMQSLENMRRSFLANVSHDLRTPMTSISGFIDAILSGAIPPEEEPHYLEIIRNEIQRLSRLVAQLLDISKLEAGERKFNMEDFNICEQGREIIIGNIQRIEDKNLELEFDCDEDDMFVNGDKDAIHQIFYNITDNAIKFSSPGSTMKIEIKRNADNVSVSVYNEGAGIPLEDQPFIFDRFYKSDKSRGKDKSGVGLGMYIARTIIEAHGQKIWLESEEGKYCRFTFTLTPASTDFNDKKQKTSSDKSHGTEYDDGRR